MTVYKIQIPASLYSRLQLGKTNYLRKQEAIDVLVKAFQQSEITFVIREKEGKTVFLNESDGELAAVVPA
jgi:hypothetical protein